MNIESIKRPSDFALSRYILEECGQEEKKRVESWVNSSEKTKEEFVSFKKRIYDEEQNSSPVFTKAITIGNESGVLSRNIILISKLRYGLGFIAFAALLLISVVSISIITNLSNRSVVQYSAPTGTHNQAFRDTLEALLRLTTKANLNSKISFHTLNRADRIMDTKNHLCQLDEIYRADRTGMYKDIGD